MMNASKQRGTVMKKKIASLILCMGMMLSICASSSSAVIAEGPKELVLSDCTENNGVYICTAASDLIVSKDSTVTVNNSNSSLIINLNGHALLVKGTLTATVSNGSMYLFPSCITGISYYPSVTMYDFRLINLQISSGTLSPAFAFNVTEYSATVDSNTSSIDITSRNVEPHNQTLLSINGQTANNDTPVTVDLQYGLNQIPVTVTADDNSGYSATYTLKVTRELAPAVESESNDPDLQLVTFLDANGSTVKVEWVEYGHDATPPTGYGIYTDYTNVTSHRDLKPAAIQAGNGYTVPCTADKS